MNFELNTSELTSTVMQLQKQRVTVGVFSSSKNRIPKRGKSLRYKNGMYQSQFKRAGAKSRTTKEVALINDNKYGLFKNALAVANQKDLINLLNEFAKIDKTPREIKRLKNIGRAIVRNPLLRRDHGMNSVKTSVAKGFNRLGVDTGTLFERIQANYDDK